MTEIIEVDVTAGEEDLFQLLLEALRELNAPLEG